MLVVLLFPSKRMLAQFQFREWMVVAFESDRLGISYVVDHLDTVSCLGDSESIAREYLLITLGVKFGKYLTELELAAIDHNGSVCSLFSLYCVLRQCVGVDAQEVTYSGSLEFHISCHSVVSRDMHYAFAYLAENPLQHIVEMNADICRHASAFVDVAFP